jgi:hypothetical protein
MSLVLAAGFAVLTPPIANAYTTTTPNELQGWDAHRTGHVSWARLPTDPKSFAVVLTRESPPYGQVIDTNVDGAQLSTDIRPPRGGFPVGTGFRLKFVKSAQDTGTVYSESQPFTIRH